MADAGNYCIRKITLQGEVTTLAGSTQGYADGSVTDAKFGELFKMGMDAYGNIYVNDRHQGDESYKIRKITPQGEVTTFLNQYHLSLMCVDISGNVYVKNGFYNFYKYNVRGEIQNLIFEEGGVVFIDGNLEDAKFVRISDATMDISGNLYVIDRNAIRKITIQELVP